MKHLILGLGLLALASCGTTAPAFADPPKLVVLKIYPKLLPPQPGEVIIKARPPAIPTKTIA